MAASVDIDKLIDWKSFYSERIASPVKPCGEHKMHACCPFHQEKEPSFWFNTQNGMWKCEAGCGSGNATTFLARMENIPTGEAYKRLLSIAGVEDKPEGPRISVKSYGLQKRLPEEFLTGLGLRNARNGEYIAIPYYDAQGRVIATRMRMPSGSNPRFKWMKGAAKVKLYGLWKLKEAHDAGYVVIVEGESDTQTLWLHGIPAVGIPGASTFNADYAKALLDIPRIYFHQEPDRGGAAARRHIAEGLVAAGYTGSFFIISCAGSGAKDPSELYAKDSAGFHAAFTALIEGAERVNPAAACIELPEGLEDAPMKFKLPPGYEISEGGIVGLNKQGVMEESPFTWTPILITRMLPGTMGDVKVELSFKSGGRWHKGVFRRSVVATTRSVIALADLGADVTSENAAAVVKWLSAFEQTNRDVIPVSRRVTHYGWVDETHFLPGAADDVYFEGSIDIRTPKGSLEAWLDAMGPHRDKSPVFRFMLASAFAPPLIKPLRQRVFMVYNWHQSKGGKSATLKAALSAWGDPDAIMADFGGTKVGLENTAALFCDLPLGIDERQMAGDKQAYLESVVYMLSGGKGKVRGNKEGGLQERKTWRTVVLANGEEALTTSTSQTGVATRVIEIYGRPFEVETEAGAMYDVVAAHHGHAGPRFARWLIAFEEKNPGAIQKVFEDVKAYVSGLNRASASKSSSIALVGTADFLLSLVLYKQDAPQALQQARAMIDAIMADEAQETDEDTDINVNAYAYIRDWIVSNATEFTDSYRRERLGCVDSNVFADATKLWVLPTKLEEALTRRGYSYKKTMRWLAENGKITVATEGKRVRDTVLKSLNGQRIRMVLFKLRDDAQPELNLAGFVPVDHDAHLPF